MGGGFAPTGFRFPFGLTLILAFPLTVGLVLAAPLRFTQDDFSTVAVLVEVEGLASTAEVEGPFLGLAMGAGEGVGPLEPSALDSAETAATLGSFSTEPSRPDC